MSVQRKHLSTRDRNSVGRALASHLGGPGFDTTADHPDLGFSRVFSVTSGTFENMPWKTSSRIPSPNLFLSEP